MLASQELLEDVVLCHEVLGRCAKLCRFEGCFGQWCVGMCRLQR